MINFKAENLSFSYGKKTVLSSLDMTISAGEVVAIIGKNGSGKTTLLKVLSGFLHPNDGNLYLGPKRLAYDSEGYCAGILENVCFWNNMTGEQNLQYYLDKFYSAERVQVLLSDWGLLSHKDRMVKTYSMGMRQKLALVLSFASPFELLFFDEPLNSLDSQSVEIFFEKVLEAKEERRSIVFTSHIIDGLSVNCDSIYELSDGKLIRKGGHDFQTPYKIGFRTKGDEMKAQQLLDKSEVLRYGPGFLIVQEVKHSISDLVRVLSEIDIVSVEKMDSVITTVTDSKER